VQQAVIGTPMQCCLRLLHATCNSNMCVAEYAMSDVLVMPALLGVLRPKLHQDTTLVLDVMLSLLKVGY
jgi:hypothetical protein